MIRVAALTDHAETPSSRYRVRQHIAGLAGHGIAVTDRPRQWSTVSAGRLFPNRRIRSSPPKAMTALCFEAMNIAQTLGRVIATRRFQAAWLSRELVIGYPTFETLLRAPLFYDIDDAVFLNPRSARPVRQIVSSATAVFAGNEYLADYCRQFNRNVHVVPTAVDTARYAPAAPPGGERFVVGWSGTSSSFRFFLPLQESLRGFFRAHPEAVLRICADRYPAELSGLREHIEYQPWTESTEVDQIRSFHLGLMPLDDSEWTKGKCSYKFLLYAACAVPTICSPYGMNAEVLRLGRVGLAATTPQEWRDALEHCFAQRDTLGALFPDCRRMVLEQFSATAVRARLGELMRRGVGADAA